MKFNFSLFCLISSILFQALGGVCAKYASQTIPEMSINSLFTNIYYMFFLLFLFFQALSWQQVLKKNSLSVTYPLMSTVKFLVLIFAFFLFNESITLYNIIGLCLISIGIILLSKKIYPSEGVL